MANSTIFALPIFQTWLGFYWSFLNLSFLLYWYLELKISYILVRSQDNGLFDLFGQFWGNLEMDLLPLAVEFDVGPRNYLPLHIFVGLF